MEPQNLAAEKVEPVPDSKKRRSRTWLYLKKFCLDMLPVIAGVVIGLFVNSYTEEQKNQSMLENTLQALSNEFTENGYELKEELLRHKQIIDSLTYYKDYEQFTLFDVLLKGGGLSLSKISTTNWRAVLNNYSLQLINFPTIKLLSAIENVHEEQSKLADWFAAIVHSPSFYERGKEGLAYRMNVLDAMTEYKVNEEELLQLYDDFASIVNSKEYQRY
jgi:hypothetical protein